MNHNLSPRPRRTTWSLLASGALLALTTTACASTEQAEPTRSAAPTPPATTSSQPDLPPPPPTTSVAPDPAVRCAYTEIDLWSSVPRDLNTPLFALILNVPEENIRQGAVGPADCAPGIPTRTITSLRAVVRVEELPPDLDVASPCLAILSDAPPGAGNVSTQPFVLCPASSLDT